MVELCSAGGSLPTVLLACLSSLRKTCCLARGCPGPDIYLLKPSASCRLHLTRSCACVYRGRAVLLRAIGCCKAASVERAIRTWRDAARAGREEVARQHRTQVRLHKLARSRRRVLATVCLQRLWRWSRRAQARAGGELRAARARATQRRRAHSLLLRCWSGLGRETRLRRATVELRARLAESALAETVVHEWYRNALARVCRRRIAAVEDVREQGLSLLSALPYSM